jgi:hypothetical protein
MVAVPAASPRQGHRGGDRHVWRDERYPRASAMFAMFAPGPDASGERAGHGDASGQGDGLRTRRSETKDHGNYGRLNNVAIRSRR